MIGLLRRNRTHDHGNHIFRCTGKVSLYMGHYDPPQGRYRAEHKHTPSLVIKPKDLSSNSPFCKSEQGTNSPSLNVPEERISWIRI